MAVESGGLNPHKLRIFCEAAERQSLTRAARHLMLSQPVVSAHVRDLERFFGARLLHQDGRRMLLTEAGEVVYRYALELFRSTSETVNVVRALHAGEAGRVVVGANNVPGTYIVPALLTAFKRERPAAEIVLLVYDTGTMFQELRQGRLDFAVMVLPEPPVDLAAEVLAHEPLILVTDPNHELTRRDTITLADLEDQTFIGRPSGNWRNLIDLRLQAHGFRQRRVAMTMSHPEGVKQAVREGIGIAIMFRCSVRHELATGVLTEIPIAGHAIDSPIYLVHRPDTRFSPMQTRLLDFLKLRMSGEETSPDP